MDAPDGRGPELKRRRPPVTSSSIAEAAQRILTAAELGQEITLSSHELRSLAQLLRRIR